MKKKIALTAVIIFVLASVGYGTYAYMTASKTTQNSISAGTVKIELSEGYEKPSKESGGLYRLSEKIMVMPSTDAERTLSVKNIGNNACYVRVKFVTEFSKNNSTLPSDEFVTMSLNDKYWVLGKNGYWYYRTALEPGKTTESLLKLIHFEKKMGNEYQNATFNMSVSAQAVQAAHNGFEEKEKESVLDVTGWPSVPVPSPTPTK